MRTCTQTAEIARAVRAGQWPHGCPSELREHGATCSICSAEVKMLLAFASARNIDMLAAPSQNSELLWWKAQLRRRHESMERLERPAVGIPAITITASIVVLLAVFAEAWKGTSWSWNALTSFTPSGWSVWVLGLVATLLCGFAVVALLLGLEIVERRS